MIDNTLKCDGPDDVRTEVPRAGELDLGGPIGVRIGPVSQLPCAAAFYDDETEALSVHIMPFNRYFSFLQLGSDRIDTDEFGSPVFIEVAQPQEDWQINPQLSLPACGLDAALRFRQTRRRFVPPKILTDPGRTVVCLKFLARRGGQIVRIAENLLAEVADGFLVAVWIGEVTPDFGERRQGRWRAAMAARLRREGRGWRYCSRVRLSEILPRERKRQFFP